MDQTALSYLSGAIGDGCLVKRSNIKRYDIQFYQKNKEWLEKSVLNRLLKLGITTKMRGPYKSCWYLKFGNKQLYQWLEANQLKLPSGDRESKVLFVRGFWDAEGSCPHVEKYLAGERKRKKIPPQVGFHQNGHDKVELLNSVRSFLIENGIECSKLEGPFYREQSNKPEFRFWVYGRKRIAKFISLIQPEHPEKRNRLELL